MPHHECGPYCIHEGNQRKARPMTTETKLSMFKWGVAGYVAVRFISEVSTVLLARQGYVRVSPNGISTISTKTEEFFDTLTTKASSKK